MYEVEHTKGLEKKDLLHLIDACVSGGIVFEEDVKHIFSVYGDTYTRDENSIVWRKEEEHT